MVCAIGDEKGNIFEKISIPTLTPADSMPEMIEYFSKNNIDALGIAYLPWRHNVLLLPDHWQAPQNNCHETGIFLHKYRMDVLPEEYAPLPGLTDILRLRLKKRGQTIIW